MDGPCRDLAWRVHGVSRHNNSEHRVHGHHEALQVVVSERPVGGVVVSVADWRWAFLINVPVGIVAIVLSLRVLSERRETAEARLPDFVGAAALGGAVGAIALGIVKGEDWGWTSAEVLGSYAAG